MKHRKNLQPLGAASRAHRLIRFNLHRAALRATSAPSCSIKPEEMNQHVGDAGGEVAVVHAMSTVEFSGGGNAPASKRMRAICVAGRLPVNSCCLPAYTP